MIKHLIIVEDELGNRRLVTPGPVVISSTERAVGMEPTPEWEAELRKTNKWFNYKFKTCLSCKEDGVYEYT